MKQRSVYKGFQVTVLVTQTPGDRFDAQIAIVAMEGGRMRWQRFLDLNDLDSEAEAARLGMAAAKDWIDDHAQHERSDSSRFVRPSSLALVD
jgi:hypothetical protein